MFADGPSDKDGDDLLPENMKGKTAAQIAAMYAELETKLGEQGNELGRLRGELQTIQTRQPADREPAKKSDYARYAEDMIVNPEETVPAFGDEIERRAVEKASRIVSAQVANSNQIESFFRANPELDKHRDIVSVIGERVYAANPQASLQHVLEETKKAAATYIANLEERFTGKRTKEADRRRAAITTGGSGNRDRVPDDDDGDRSQSGMSPEQQSVMDEIKRIKEHRAKRITPPRSR